MEHPELGYKEVTFEVQLSGVLACRGALIDDLVSAD